MPMTPNLSELAEQVTHESLPELFKQLHSRPKPHNPEYEILILQQVAESLGSSLWKIFLMYQDEIGEKLPHLTEKVWQRSYPDFYSLAFLESKMGTVLQFPADRIRPKRRGRKPSININLNNIKALSAIRHE